MCIDSWITRTVSGCPRCQGWGRSCCRPCPRPSPPTPLGSHRLLFLLVSWSELAPLKPEDLDPWGIDLIPCLLSLRGWLWITPRNLQLYSLHWTSCLLRSVELSYALFSVMLKHKWITSHFSFVLVWLTMCGFLYIFLMLLIPTPIGIFKRALVALGGRPFQCYTYLSVSLSSF